MKKPFPRFGLAALVSQPATETLPGSVDALLFAPAGSATPPGKTPTTPGSSPAGKTRFTNILPTPIYVQLHQLAFWDRRDMSAIIDAALQEYFATRPDATRPLPEQERLKRRLPS